MLKYHKVWKLTKLRDTREVNFHKTSGYHVRHTKSWNFLTIVWSWPVSLLAAVLMLSVQLHYRDQWKKQQLPNKSSISPFSSPVAAVLMLLFSSYTLEIGAKVQRSADSIVVQVRPDRVLLAPLLSESMERIPDQCLFAMILFDSFWRAALMPGSGNTREHLALYLPFWLILNRRVIPFLGLHCDRSGVCTSELGEST